MSSGVPIDFFLVVWNHLGKRYPGRMVSAGSMKKIIDLLADAEKVYEEMPTKNEPAQAVENDTMSA